ncbi:MAG: methyltransferase [Geminicoccaceae bacterium]|nr:methyltransferase [Geminicoccaceae bacterium]
MRGETSSTRDTLLDGRVSLLQPSRGYRVAIDTLLAAAAVPIRPGQSLLDAGAGTGALGLCVMARVRGVQLTAVEILDRHVDYLEANLAHAGARIVAGDITSDVLRGENFDHVATNPPFFEPGAHRLPRCASKRSADHAGIDPGSWMEACMRRTVSGGTLVVINTADKAGLLLSEMSGRFGDLLVVPIFTRPGHPFAHRVILRGRKGSRAPLRLHKGLYLRRENGDETDEARAILRDAAGLDTVMEGTRCSSRQ